MVIFFSRITVESVAYSLTSGFHAETLIAILKVKKTHFIGCVCKEPIDYVTGHGTFFVLLHYVTRFVSL